MRERSLATPVKQAQACIHIRRRHHIDCIWSWWRPLSVLLLNKNHKVTIDIKTKSTKYKYDLLLRFNLTILYYFVCHRQSHFFQSKTAWDWRCHSAWTKRIITTMLPLYLLHLICSEKKWHRNATNNCWYSFHFRMNNINNSQHFWSIFSLSLRDASTNRSVKGKTKLNHEKATCL